MGAAGVLHFVVPESYAKIVPGVLGRPRALVAVTGVAELVAAGLVAVPRTRRAGAWLSIGLLVVVFPANVKMALDGGLEGYGFPLGSPVVAWLRLPLQVPLVVWAWRVASRADRPPAPAPGSVGSAARDGG
ncbi:MAG: hypothetical protein QOD63_152 [Actinomycetota bacterium]|nr:hypothetical protein [Actinomycetota bacterium]